MPETPRSSPILRRLARYWMWLLVAAGAIVVTLVHRDYGVTWDEGVQARYGELALSYFTSGLRDDACDRYLDLRFYGPLFEMIPAALYSPESKYETRHLLLGLLALLVVPAVGRYARAFGLPWLAPLALLALVTLPRFVGHLHNNSKDVPFAVATAWLLVAAVALALRRGRRGWRVAAAGAALGLAACARPAGFPLLALYLLGTVALASLLRPFAAGDRRAMWLEAALALPIGWMVMVLPRPWAHGGPVFRPLAAMLGSVATAYPVVFEGEVHSSPELPWYYLLKYLLITTPPAILVLGLAGAGLAVGWLVRERHRRRAFLGAVTLLWLVLPLAVFVVRRPNVYDGLRHFLFLLPAGAVLAAVGAAAILERLRRRWRAVAVPVLLLALALPVRDLAGLHPYQMTYFNALVGGLEGAGGRYETDYWISSYREAMLWINHRAHGSGRTVRVMVAGAEGDYARPAAEHYAAAHVEVVTPHEGELRRLSRADVDYYLATTRYGLDRTLDDPIVHTVGRRGAVFAVIKKVSAAGGGSGPPPLERGELEGDSLG